MAERRRTRGADALASPVSRFGRSLQKPSTFCSGDGQLSVSQEAQQAIAAAPAAAPDSSTRPPPRTRIRRASEAPTPTFRRGARAARSVDHDSEDEVPSPTQIDDIAIDVHDSPEHNSPPAPEHTSLAASPPPDGHNPLAPADRPRDDPIIMVGNPKLFGRVGSGVRCFNRWLVRRMKASAFDAAQNAIATPYLNSTASPIDVLYQLEHHARDPVMCAFIREAFKENDPDQLVEYVAHI